MIMRLPDLILIAQSFRNLCIAALLTLGLAAPAPAVESNSSYVRVGEVMMRPPDGWQSGVNGETRILTPPNVPAGQTVTIVVSPVAPPKPTLRAHMEAELESGAKLGGFKQESPIVPVRHAAGYEVLGMLVSFYDRPIFFQDTPKVFAMVVHVDAGKELGSVPVMLYCSTKELCGQHIKTFDRFVSDLRIPARMVLAEHPGQPPLTLRTVNQVNDFLEWLMETPFTQGQRQQVADHLIDAWRKGDREGAEAVQAIAGIRNQLDALTSDQKALAREAARAEAMKAWRAEAVQGDAMAKLMVGIHDAAHKPLVDAAPGQPPLTRQSADASIEILYFMASKAADPRSDGFELRPAAERKDEWAREMAAAYKDMDATKRDEIAQMPTLWAALRVLWPTLSTDERTKLAAAWAQTPAVQALAAQVKKGQDDAQLEDAKRVGRAYWAHRQSIDMGLYRLNYFYPYK
jgi:hypothetical protein